MKKVIFLFIILAIPAFCFGQMAEYLEEDPEPVVKRHRGFAYSLLEYGSGLGFFLELPLEGFYHIGGSFDAFMLRDSKEFTIPSYYYGGYYQINKRNNVYMFDLMFSVKKRFFARDLDNSLRPFISLQAGPLFAMNFPEEYLNDQGEVVKDDDQYMWTMSAAGALGIDADVNKNTFMGLRLQYRLIPFAEKLGERKNQSTLDIRLEIGQKF